MKRWSWRKVLNTTISFTLLALFTLTVSANADTPVVGRRVGQVFPQVVLPSLDGKRTLSLTDFRGKKVLLIEFASW